ncbi:transcription regulator [Natronococcus amylolyticus DSM 10524]|uniref:Transcription regulator n=1 Tax=Natronococcus amylolyticus DSM 10524 TaxID=1227497 RepID=L9X257_9EURY|nr:ribbon-helix-helix protein, CopG family [Natronococcus amylolyticus]ELY54673.1 transcription regulator [Natronococcus amylolyticus DSM 10524]
MRTSLAVPDGILEEFDATWRAEGIDSRSRAVREAMAEYVERHRTLETTTGSVTGVVVFDYEHESVIERLHDVQHDYQDAIVSTSHAHQGDWCLETVFVEGEAERVRRLVYRLKDFDGVRRVRFMFL